MRRGLKAQAEKAAAAARTALRVAPLSALDPWAYAKCLGLVVLDFAELGLSKATTRQLLVVDSESWSAMTLREGSTTAIVVNSSHKITRRRSDLMHEIAHFELRHLPSRVEVSKNTGMLLLSDYSDDHELEADWHGAALLLPRAALTHYRARRNTVTEIAALYGVSEQLCEWRLRMTGVDIQLRRTHGAM
jgi:Zn-dependent peptidase ImmA (M78 family)